MLIDTKLNNTTIIEQSSYTNFTDLRLDLYI